MSEETLFQLQVEIGDGSVTFALSGDGAVMFYKIAPGSQRAPDEATRDDIDLEGRVPFLVLSFRNRKALDIVRHVLGNLDKVFEDDEAGGESG